MNPFRWGTQADFLGALDFTTNGAVTEKGPGGTKFTRVDLVPQGGSGSLEYFHGKRLHVLVFDCSFPEGSEYEVVDAGWLRWNFALNLSVNMTLADTLQVQAATPSWRFMRMPAGAASPEVISPDARLQWITICCCPALLEELTGARPEELRIGETGDLADRESLVHRSFAFTPALLDATADILSARVARRLRASYLLSKAYELLVLGVDHILASSKPDHGTMRLSDRDIRTLHAIRSLVDADLSETPSIRSLSLKMGINRTKLHYGFKKLFGTSLSQHVQERRITEAYRLLTTTDLSVGQIAARVGFQHQCNLSTAFKTRYGFSPASLRRQVGCRCPE